MEKIKEFLVWLWNRIVAIVTPWYEQTRSLAHMHEDTDIPATIAQVKKNIEFSGANLWILMFAIAIASLGLMINSTAVIIGAMLISPLMGPIMGVGLAVATNDSDMLQRAMRNLAVMVGISLVVSTVYFILSPMDMPQSELLARTSPTIFDVLIALFGGAAGIVAASRKEGMSLAIAGVAIATALMPPLCTAGYGLATLQPEYFIGAAYLFCINSFFIALSTFLISRYLRFPRVEFLDKKKERRVRNAIMLFTAIIVVPSVIITVGLVRKSRFEANVHGFTKELKTELPDSVHIINIIHHYDSKAPQITINLAGKPITDADKSHFEDIKHEHNLSGTVLHIAYPGTNMPGAIGASAVPEAPLVIPQAQAVPEPAPHVAAPAPTAAVAPSPELQAQLQVISKQISSIDHYLQKSDSPKIPYEQLAKEMNALFPSVREFGIDPVTYTNTYTMAQATYYTLNVKFADNTLGTVDMEQRLGRWIEARLGVSPVKVVKY